VVNEDTDSATTDSNEANSANTPTCDDAEGGDCRNGDLAHLLKKATMGLVAIQAGHALEYARMFRELVTISLSPLLASCSRTGEGNDVRKPTAAEDFDTVQCSAVRASSEPDLMAWDAHARSNLKDISEQGIVAVRHEAKGCDVRLEVLANCTADGTYTFSPSAATGTKITRSAHELYSSLPLGAAHLAAKLQNGKVLRADYMQVGARLLPTGTTISRSQLRGDGCDRATHVVTRIVVGGFGMAAMEEKNVDVSVGVFGVGGHGSLSGAVEWITSEGIPVECKEAQRDSKERAGCATPLRVGLQQLNATAQDCPSGMLTVAAGSYQMGSENGNPDEKPVHIVRLRAYCVDATEVTVGAYRSCVGAGGCRSPQSTVDPECNWGQSARENHPINCVNWNEAKSYCEWNGARLPTEEEWEYAARGIDGRTYPWGEDAPGPGLLNGCGAECKAWAARNRMNWNALYDASDGWETTSPVGSFPTGNSPFGLKDMAGNVWEWTESGYSADYGTSRTTEHRVYRGGSSLNGEARFFRSANRGGNTPSNRSINLGFRCAR